MLRQILALACLLSWFAPIAAAQKSSTDQPPPSKTQVPPSPPAKTGTLEQRVEQYLRNYYAWGPSFEVKVGPAKSTPIPDILEVPVTVSMGGQGDTASVYVSKDGKFMFRGELSDMSVDLFAETRAKLQVGNSPSIGPADAKVTLVEFADFECPSCRELDRILREVLPSHPEVRLVYKDYPLTDIHPWAMTAAIAGQCASQQGPQAFWKLHDSIFDAQQLISPANASDKINDLANQAGLNLDAFRTCIASPEPTHAIEASIEQGHTLNVNSTPTIFANGRRIVGADRVLVDQLIQFELAR
jgi:protein-disulfide isomerase